MSAGLCAQRNSILNLDWRSMGSDSVCPWYGFAVPLGEGWQDSVYGADIEYPELVRISSDDINRWKLNSEDIPEWPDVHTFIGVTRGKATLDVGFMPVVRQGRDYFIIQSFKPVISSSLSKTGRRAPDTDPGERYTTESLLSRGNWVKIKVPETGIYKLTYSSLRSMGFSDPSKVRLFGYGGAVLPETRLQNLTDDLPEQPLWHANSYMLFYAQGPVNWKRESKNYVHSVNTYSDWGYYFLTDDADGDKAVFNTIEADGIMGSPIDRYPDFAVYDPDEYSWFGSGRRFFESADCTGSSRSYRISTEGIIADSVGMTIAVSASSSETTRLSISVNGLEAGTMSIRSKASQNVARIKEQSYVSLGQFKDESVIKFSNSSGSSATTRLDFIRLNFKRKLALYGSATIFRTGRNESNASFSIANSTQDVLVWRIKDDGSSDIIPSEFIDGKTFTKGASYSADDILVAVNPNGQFPEPKVVGHVANQNLHGMDSIDMVIVVPSSGKLTNEAERLAQAHREIDGLSVAVVRADMIYNEFSSGTPDATALRRFMKMLYDRGGEGAAPRYLLLMGDGAWDNRMHVPEWKGENPDDYLLCYESYESMSHTASYVMEDYFGLLDDGEGVSLLAEKVDIGVGRLAVSTASQARSQVDKIIDYMKGRWAGSWCNRILVLGDDGDNNTHMIDADSTAILYAEAYPDIDIRKIYWDAYKMEISASYNGYPTVRKQLLEELDKGALIVNYSGHGSAEVLSHELVVNKSDMKKLTSRHLPFWITASCDIAPFDSPEESLGMNLVRNEQGGAIGILSTTRTVYASLNKTINRSFSRYVLAYGDNGQPQRLGDALRLAKNELVTRDFGETDLSENKIHYVLLGDPALRLAAPEMSVVVDSFDGKDSSNPGIASAGSVITVRGHIEYNGKKQDNFNGMLSGTVYDNERTITCYNNLNSADNKFQFRYRDRILYSGMDSVRNGEFMLTFPVPMDINYSNENGLITLYAVNNNRDMSAHGHFSNFTVGGTSANLARDSIGPDLHLYLNTPSFQYGGNVNGTPLLVAELKDSSGINTSGNGIGHDILLIVDNNPNWTWVLNSYFEQAPGDYTSGTVTFPIPELPEGKHELMLRAWDMMNNSTTVYLGFKVIYDLQPRFTIDVMESPAREQTTFVITHDRPGQSASVSIQVADMNGSVQWTNTVTDSSNAGVTLVPWNLHGNSGHRMQPGLYIVRASVGTDGGGSSSASCKLVIVGR